MQIQTVKCIQITFGVSKRELVEIHRVYSGHQCRGPEQLMESSICIAELLCIKCFAWQC